LGDPALTSKELKTISGILARKVKQIECFIVDNSFFDYRSKFNGRSNTNNPYDALNSAFMVNFNTVALRVLGSGTVLSNEPETPLTEIARRRGLALSRGNHRVNFGTSLEEGGVNGVQILAHFLRENGLRVANKVFFAPIPKQSNLLYNHSSSLRLTEALNGMLKYSNNVVANQIFLFLGAHKYGAPATFEKGQKVVNNFLTKEIGWRVGKVVEGSGLSRETRVTPYEMVRLLRWFEVYESLLPEESNSQVKTGTLNGVNALVGFTTVHKSEKIRFALLVNSQVPFNYKFKVLELLKRSVL
jgi:D-alanyl-D-alanine carboxypeptidase/D-alanyl-D-alanine-endopeptidase (penicillin-binding protein 4)